MSVRLMGEVWRRECDAASQLVLLALADHADDDGAQCYPSVGRLAWKIGRSVRQVRRVLSDLRARGVLEVVTPGGGAAATRYRLRLDLLAVKPEYVPERRTPDAHDRGDTHDTPDTDDRRPLTSTSATPDAHDRVTIKEPSREPSRERARARRFPDGMVLTEPMRTQARAVGCADPGRAFEAFENHHRAKGSRFVDWPRAWGTWLSRHGTLGCPCGGGRRGTGKPTAIDHARSIAARWAAEGAG